jgi:hypothetical protein
MTIDLDRKNAMQDDESVGRVMDGAAWREFCDALKAAGDVILSPDAPESPYDRAEGFRYLSRLTRAALETFVENADPQAPTLLRTAHETVKMGADNPDNLYQNAPISGKYEYAITGNRGSVHYLGFGTQAGNYGATGSLETTGYLDASQLTLDAGGNFSVVVSAREGKGPNWLPMREDSSTLVVRQTFLDRASERPAEIRIRRTDGPHRPRHLSPRALDRGLRASGRFVGGCAKLFQAWASSMVRTTNTLPEFDAAVAKAAGGDPNIVYYHSYWRLEPDQALVIDVVPPECDYWNFQLNNHWMESLDYRYFPISVNKHSAKRGADGSVRIVVAHENPGVENWIDTCGHDRGTMCWRWIRPERRVTPTTRVVKLAELRR